MPSKCSGIALPVKLGWIGAMTSKCSESFRKNGRWCCGPPPPWSSKSGGPDPQRMTCRSMPCSVTMPAPSSMQSLASTPSCVSGCFTVCPSYAQLHAHGKHAQTRPRKIANGGVFPVPYATPAQLTDSSIYFYSAQGRHPCLHSTPSQTHTIGI